MRRSLYFIGVDFVVPGRYYARYSGSGCSGAHYLTVQVSLFMEGFFTSAVQYETTGCAIPREATRSERVRGRERAERSTATHGASKSIAIHLCRRPLAPFFTIFLEAFSL